MTQRVDRYGRARQRSLSLADWMIGELAGRVGDDEAGRPDPDGMRAALAKLRDCGSYLEFRQYVTLDGWPVRLHAASFCKQPKLCAFCAIRRATKLLRSYLPKVLTLIEGGYFPYFVTFTARNGGDLGDRYALIDRTLRGLMKAGYWSRLGRGRDHAWSSIEAAVFSYEMKRGRGSGLWHPHAHGLIFVRRELLDAEATDIIDAWCQGTDDSDPRGQDIRPLRSLPSLDAPECFTESQLAEGVGSDLVEVFKYPLKFSSMEPADTWHAARRLDGKHLIRPFGGLRGVKISQRYVDEPLDVKDLPYLRLLLLFDPVARGYVTRERIFIDGTSGNG